MTRCVLHTVSSVMWREDVQFRYGSVYDGVSLFLWYYYTHDIYIYNGQSYDSYEFRSGLTIVSRSQPLSTTPRQFNKESDSREKAFLL